MKTLELPKVLRGYPCPICGAKVILTAVTEWETSGKPLTIEYECETEPPIDSREWWTWHRGHWSMPYVYWLPWETVALRMLQRCYRYDPEWQRKATGGQLVAPPAERGPRRTPAKKGEGRTQTLFAWFHSTREARGC